MIRKHGEALRRQGGLNVAITDRAETPPSPKNHHSNHNALPVPPHFPQRYLSPQVSRVTANLQGNLGAASPH